MASELEPNYEVSSVVTRFIRSAVNNIDIAIYDIDNPKIVQALIDKAASGVKVRVIADSKNPTTQEYIDRYIVMRNYLESMRRGKDGVIGTGDDITIFSDSPIFTVSPVNDLPNITATVGTKTLSGNVISYGETKNTGEYYSAGQEMHHKFIIVDNNKVLSGSANYTETGNINTQNMIEIKSTEVANAYKFEFEQMWGSNTMTPDPVKSNFGSRKQLYAKTSFVVNNTPIEVYFGPKSKIMDKVTSIVNNEADKSLYFSIFSWSYDPLIEAVRSKYDHNDPNKTKIDLKGTFDYNSWNQSWSASKCMLGTSSVAAENWSNHPSVLKSYEERKLHSKYMIIDVNSESNPTVITGSPNWSASTNTSNDENLIVIRDGAIAKQYFNDFVSVYERAGGVIDETNSSWTRVGNLKSPRAYFDVIVKDNKIWSYFGLKENYYQTDYEFNGITHNWVVPTQLDKYNTTIESFDINNHTTNVINTNSVNQYGFNIYKSDIDNKYKTFSGLNMDKTLRTYELNEGSFNQINDSSNSSYIGYNMRKFSYKGKDVVQGIKGTDQSDKTSGFIYDGSGIYDFDDTRSSFDGLLYGDKLYFVGGLNYNKTTKEAQYFLPISFDLKTKNFENFGDKKIERSGGQAIIHRGMLFYIGGSKLNSSKVFEASSDVDIYDFNTGKWFTGPDMSNPRMNHSAAEVSDKLYVLGGMNSSIDGAIDHPDSVNSEIECYNSYAIDYADKTSITNSINYIIKEGNLYIKCIKDIPNTWITIGGYDGDKVFNLEMKNGNFIELPISSEVNSVSVSPYVLKYNSIDFYGKISIDISNSKVSIDREKSVLSESSFDLVITDNNANITKLQIYNNSKLLYEGLDKVHHINIAKGNNNIIVKGVFPNGDILVLDEYPIYIGNYAPDFQEKEYNYIYNEDNTLKEIRDSMGNILVEFVYDENGNLKKSIKHKGAN